MTYATKFTIAFFLAGVLVLVAVIVISVWLAHLETRRELKRMRDKADQQRQDRTAATWWSAKR